MVIRGGENIYPREIEEILLTNEAIKEVYVIGVPDDRMGEELCAWINLNSGASMNEEEVKTYLKGKVSGL